MFTINILPKFPSISCSWNMREYVQSRVSGKREYVLKKQFLPISCRWNVGGYCLLSPRTTIL